MSSLMEDIDALMHPFRCKFGQAFTPDEWHDWYEWMIETYGMDDWYLERNTIAFKREEDLMMFLLRWS